MKLIHCADLHIGSKMDSKYPAQKAHLRRQELRNAFIRLVDEAEKDHISIIMISGDAFDSDHPSEKDLDYFYGVIESHPSIKFFYLRGNHDLDGFGPQKALSNLFTFSSNEWTTYAFQKAGVTISGIEINDENKDSFYDAEGLNIDSTTYNIAMLHGQVGSEIDLKKLAHRNLNYIALGHVHSFKEYELEDKGDAIYSGTLEPRGFDEVGEKGFVIIDTSSRKYTFKPFNERTVHWEKLDISEIKTEYDVSNAIKAMLANPKDIYRVELTGAKTANLRLNIENIVSRCSSGCFLLDIIDKTAQQKLLAKDIDKNTPLVQEFIKNINAENTLNDDEKAKAIQIGLNALSGKEF